MVTAKIRRAVWIIFLNIICLNIKILKIFHPELYQEVMTKPCHCQKFFNVRNLLRELDVYWKEGTQQILFYLTTTYCE